MPSKKNILRAITWLLFLFASQIGYAILAKHKENLIIAPCLVFGFDDEKKIALRKKCSNSLKELFQRKEKSFVRIDKLLEKDSQKFSQNLMRSLSSWSMIRNELIERKWPKDKRTILLTHICPLNKKPVLNFKLISMQKGFLLDSVHSFNLENENKAQTKATKPLKVFEATWNKLLEKPSIKNESDSVLKLKIASKQTWGTINNGSDKCVKNLLEEDLINRGFIIIPQNYSLSNRSLRALFEENKDLAKANRFLFMTVEEAKNTLSTQAQMSRKYMLKLSYSTAIFSQKIISARENFLELKLKSLEKKLQLDPKLLSKILSDQKNLSLSENPMISKIYKAWVYLDKGRAWGLKINDRLIDTQANEKIEGHVIGFYKLKDKVISPRTKEMIPEGAIIFIRKGQRQTKIGQTMTFDPKTYGLAE